MADRARLERDGRNHVPNTDASRNTIARAAFAASPRLMIVDNPGRGWCSQYALLDQLQRLGIAPGGCTSVASLRNLVLDFAASEEAASAVLSYMGPLVSYVPRVHTRRTSEQATLADWAKAMATTATPVDTLPVELWGDSAFLAAAACWAKVCICVHSADPHFRLYGLATFRPVGEGLDNLPVANLAYVSGNHYLSLAPTNKRRRDPPIARDPTAP